MEIWADSLARRIQAMHSLGDIGVRDLTLEQVNRHERSGVLPITFTLMHSVQDEDDAASRFLLNEPMFWDSADWAARIGPSLPNVEWHTPLEIAEQLTFENLDAWRDYQSAVFSRTETAIAELDPERYLETPLGAELPSWLDGGFITYAFPAKEGPILLDIIECFIFQHGIRHLGELEHDRALVGLGGTS